MGSPSRWSSSVGQAAVEGAGAFGGFGGVLGDVPGDRVVGQLAICGDGPDVELGSSAVWRSVQPTGRPCSHVPPSRRGRQGRAWPFFWRRVWTGPMLPSCALLDQGGGATAPPAPGVRLCRADPARR
jgi:hypothetical protein